MTAKHLVVPSARPELSEESAVFPPNPSEELLGRAVLRLNGNILGLALGIMSALVIFAATNWLVIKGGLIVGPHLELLREYFIGYSVSFIGSLVGMAYAFVLGYLSGFVIAWVYNGVVLLTARRRE